MKLESVTEVKIELEQTPDVPTKWKERLVPFLFVRPVGRSSKG